VSASKKRKRLPAHDNTAAISPNSFANTFDASICCEPAPNVSSAMLLIDWRSPSARSKCASFVCARARLNHASAYISWLSSVGGPRKVDKGEGLRELTIGHHSAPYSIMQPAIEFVVSLTTIARLHSLRQDAVLIEV